MATRLTSSGAIAAAQSGINLQIWHVGRTFDLRILADVQALACLVAEEEVIVAGFRELVDEVLPVLRAEAANGSQGANEAGGGEMHEAATSGAVHVETYAERKGEVMTAVVTTEQEQTADIDLDALEVDATRRLGELREQRGRLALDALGDAEVASELEAVERDIRATEQALERVQLARSEHGRRESAAAQAAEAQRVEAALTEARRLQRERERAVKLIDESARKLAAALATYATVCANQQRSLGSAGRKGGPAPSSAIERALVRAFSDAGVPAGMVDLPPLSGKPALLAELDPVHIDTAAE